MSYSYESERHNIFSEEGIDILTKIRDESIRLHNYSGCFTVEKVMSKCIGSTFTMLAAIDYLVEKGELEKVFDRGPTQKHIYRRK